MAGTSGQAAGDAFEPTTAEMMPSAAVTTLHLLRHGEVERLRERAVRGQLDVPLSERGRAQGRRLAEWLRAVEPAPRCVVTSDLGRCRELAEEHARALGRPLVVEPRLREQHLGAWQGRTWDEISAAEPAAVSAYWRDHAHARPPGGESTEDLVERVGSWLDEEAPERGGGRLHVVTHVGVIRALLVRLLGLPPTETLRFAPATASHTAVLWSEAGAVVTALGERPWLADAARERSGALGNGRESGRSAPSTSTPQAPHSPGAPGSTPRTPAGDDPFPSGSRPIEHAIGGAIGHGAGTRSSAESKEAPRRIALSGSAGTGKTTLGRALAGRLGVAYVAEGMRARLEAGLDVHTLDAAGWRALLADLWAEQRAAEEAAVAATGGFVADRSSLDFAAFWLHYDLHFEGSTEAWIARMAAEAARYERVVLLPWGALPLAADGVRSTNAWAQLRFQGIVEGVLARWLAPERLLRVPAEVRALDARVAHVTAALRAGGATSAG